MDLKSKIILIAGPTACGKSDFALKLSKKIKGEIINADSMQVYRETKILTARPDTKEQKKVKHHLYGFLSIKRKFSTGRWLKLVLKKIKEIQKRKKIPILVGGTGLYFKALTEGLVKIPNIPIKYRKKIISLQKKIGQIKFFSKLVSLDPLIKDKIKPSDTQRSIRAYEVKLYTKKSLIEWFNKTKSKYDKNDFIRIYIDFPRVDLIQRISNRTDEMIKKGAIDEVKKFLKMKVKKSNSSNKIIGINEISEYLKKNSELSKVKEKISIKTRQYAKRQRTWARGQMKNWQLLKPQDLKIFLKKI